MWQFTETTQQRFGTWRTLLRHGLPWPARWAMTCGIAVVVVPLIALLLAGLVVGLASYLVFSLIARIGEMFGLAASPRGPRPDEEIERRVNVRVID